MVPFEEISDLKNNFNKLTTLYRCSKPEDIQSIEGHLNGGIPEFDIDALNYLERISNLKKLFESAGRQIF